MVLSDRLLLGPGPSNPYPEAIAALGRPMLGHMDPEFIALMDDTMARLRSVFRTANELTFPVSGTGSAGMEACFVNLLEAGDTAIVGANGVFGDRMCEVARRGGAEVVRIEEEWGRPLDPQRLLDAQAQHPQARVVAVVHAETSTGVENDIAPLASLRDTDTLLLVDTVTSLAGIPVEIDAWGVDAAYSGTQKCLGVPPGLAPVTFSPRAVERIRTRAIPPIVVPGRVARRKLRGGGSHYTHARSRWSSRSHAVGRARRGLEQVWASARSVGDRLRKRCRTSFNSWCPEAMAPRLLRGSPKVPTRRPPQGAARLLRHRGRRGARPVRGQGVAHRADGSLGARPVRHHAARRVARAPRLTGYAGTALAPASGARNRCSR
jgi:alanine-glyoxylate transaminase/serine-glyoxylate transaminase/serine-pyruvate transaminase